MLFYYAQPNSVSFAVVVGLTEVESDADEEMAVEPIASDSEDDGSNLSNISSDDELSNTQHSTPSINNTLADLYKTSVSSVPQ